MQPGIPQDTAVRVYRRYLRLEPTHAEEYIAYLKSKVVSTFSKATSLFVSGGLYCCPRISGMPGVKHCNTEMLLTPYGIFVSKHNKSSY